MLIIAFGVNPRCFWCESERCLSQGPEISAYVEVSGVPLLIVAYNVGSRPMYPAMLNHHDCFHYCT